MHVFAGTGSGLHCWQILIFFLCLCVKFHKSLFWVPILAAGGPYWVPISQKVGSPLGPYLKGGSLLNLETVYLYLWINRGWMGHMFLLKAHQTKDGSSDHSLQSWPNLLKAQQTKSQVPFWLEVRDQRSNRLLVFILNSKFQSGEGEDWISAEDHPKWFIRGRIFSWRGFVKAAEGRQDKSKVAGFVAVWYFLLQGLALVAVSGEPLWSHRWQSPWSFLEGLYYFLTSGIIKRYQCHI